MVTIESVCHAYVDLMYLE